MASGGYRPGAGRPKGSGKGTQKGIDSPVEDSKKSGTTENLTPLEFLLKVMRDATNDVNTRLRAASLAAPFVHTRASDGKGKKVEKEEKAKAASTGRFATSAPPAKVLKFPSNNPENP